MFDNREWSFAEEVQMNCAVARCRMVAVGHQDRVDYLAKHAAQSTAGIEIGDRLSYDDWIDEGLKVYDRETETIVVWRAAFSRER